LFEKFLIKDTDPEKTLCLQWVTLNNYGFYLWIFMHAREARYFS